MMKYISLLFLMLTVIGVNCQSIKDIAYQSAMTNCPLSSFNGKTCPIQISNNKFNNDIKIIGGIGFDSIKQTTKLPILKSNTHTKISEEKYEYYEYNKVSEFYDLVYKNNKEAKAGLYSRREGAEELFKNFYSNNMKATLSQKIYVTHKVDSVNQIDEYFEKAIKLLPEVYDKDMYDMIVTYWGDSYISNASYGGIFENQRALRECHNADIKDVQKNIDSLINTGKASKDVRFLEYSMFSSSDIIGGNPELTNVTERVNSIKYNQVFIFGIKQPIWMAIPEGKIRENMKIHLNDIDDKIDKFIETSKKRIHELFIEDSKNEKYMVYDQYYPLYDFSLLPFPEFWAFSCPMPPRPECYNCRETSDHQRSGYTRGCVINQERFNFKAVESYEKRPPGEHHVIENTIDENGYYKRKTTIYNTFFGEHRLIQTFESEKVRSGCVIGDAIHPTPGGRIPKLNWKWGADTYYCIKCIPWINYIQEWGQTQEYLQCSCPKTI